MGFLIDAVAAYLMLASDMLLQIKLIIWLSKILSATSAAVFEALFELYSIVVGGVDSQV